jgi:3-deoxy-manno-octulosonate cytidylyltransferase (CMP-KDO synthetase)
VYERARQAGLLDEVVVATDDERIAFEVRSFGGQVQMTDSSLPTGTDRCAAVAKVAAYAGYGIVVNIQGDEPLIQPAMIDRVVQVLAAPQGFDIGTLVRECSDRESYVSPHAVKAVTDINGRALYFSRSPIPSAALSDETPVPDFLLHVGLYAFRRAVLLKLSGLATGRWEGIERLEQLRWLEHGLSIGTAVTDGITWGVDTPEDLKRVARLLAEES